MSPLPCCTHERGKNFRMFTQGFSARPRYQRGLGPPHAGRPAPVSHQPTLIFRGWPRPLPPACAVLFLCLVLARPMAQPAAQPQVPGSVAEPASGGGGQPAACLLASGRTLHGQPADDTQEPHPWTVSGVGHSYPGRKKKRTPQTPAQAWLAVWLGAPGLRVWTHEQRVVYHRAACFPARSAAPPHHHAALF